jgi:isopenicillin-N N-acyltransferase like protein
MTRSRLLLTLLACFVTTAIRGEEPFRFPEKKHGTGELRYLNKVPVLTVSGTPDEIGEAVGILAVKPAPKVLDYPQGVLKHFSAGLLWHLILSKGRDMVKHFPADYRDEMESLTRSSGAARDKIVAGNTLFDVKKIVLCSALMVEGDRSATGGPLLGRNLDYPSLDYIQDYSLVTVYRPRGKHAFVSVGFPGLVGTLSGMNDVGLSVAVLEVFAARKGEVRFDPKGIPYAMIFRSLLEECTTIDEARKKLEKMPRTTMFNMIAADREKVGTFEITPTTVVFRPSEKGINACTNHFCTDEVKPEKKLDVAGSYGRFDYLEAIRDQKERISVDDVKARLHGANLGDFTLQTMIFEPKTLKLHVALGTAPSSRLPLRTIELEPLFKGK